MINYGSSMAEGKSAEERFVVDYILTFGIPKSFNKASQYQDMHQHWDIDINGDLIDVKGRRRLSRGSSFNDNFAIFEMKNVNGKTGWGYGLSNIIAYEFSDRWILVDRGELISLIESKLSDDEQIYCKFAGPYKNHSRENRKDLFTWVPIQDLENIKINSFLKRTDNVV